MKQMISLVKNVFRNSKDIWVVPTLVDPVQKDSLWCVTLALVWNDLKKNVVKKDIVFTPQEEIADHLNQEGYLKNCLSSKSYYQAYGIKTMELKKKIEEEIFKQFQQTSDLLEHIDWNEEVTQDIQKYLFYTMLYKEFEFMEHFDVLEKGKFGHYNQVAYFGIRAHQKPFLNDQIEVLYYDHPGDFAFLLRTKTDDELIFCKKPKGTTFQNIYDKIMEKSQTYDGRKCFLSTDELKIPYLSFQVNKEYLELENKPFEMVYGIGKITKAMQTIEFHLTEKGGKIKSEAAIDMETTSLPIVDDPRYFWLDDSFAFFVKEKEADTFYFAGKIDDITKFQ